MKICRTCKVEKEEVLFSKSKKHEDGLQKECKECQGKYLKNHYANNKESYKQRALRQIKRNKDYVNSLKKECVNCGFDNPIAIDFHHIDPKSKYKDIAELVIINNKQKLEEEIKKCIPLCSNCHRILHWEENHGQMPE